MTFREAMVSVLCGHVVYVRTSEFPAGVQKIRWLNEDRALSGTDRANFWQEIQGWWMDGLILEETQFSLEPFKEEAPSGGRELLAAKDEEGDDYNAECDCSDCLARREDGSDQPAVETEVERILREAAAARATEISDEIDKEVKRLKHGEE